MFHFIQNRVDAVRRRQEIERAVYLACYSFNGGLPAPDHYGVQVIYAFEALKKVDFDPNNSKHLEVIAGMGALLWHTDQQQKRQYG